MSDRERPYLFPAPADVLRNGLNAWAELGREFIDDQAATDIMLDLDLIKSGRLKKLHAYSYYAQRWGWSKTRVARSFSGDKARDIAPWIEERATAFRAFFGERSGTQWERSGTQSGANDTEKADLGTQWERSGTQWERSRTDLQTTDNSPSHARAHEDGGEPDLDLDATPYEIYKQAPGAKASVLWMDLINSTVGETYDRKLVWAQVCTIWATSEKPGGGRYNVANVRGMINHFKEQINEQSTSRIGGNTGDVDPAENLERNRALTRAALGLEP